MKKNPPDGFLNWFEIARLGLVQMMLGSIVVLTTSTMNRVMVVELALPAMLPGIFVGIHYAIQVLRPRWGHSTDQKGARTPWIVGGMVVLATGGLLAAVATARMASNTIAGILQGLVAFLMIGIGGGP
ncbi:MAG: PucC family protein, partial [Rhodospirillaceae bacterium]|nr:PucC family protein [Rhodospirillaceae bacterium]